MGPVHGAMYKSCFPRPIVVPSIQVFLCGSPGRRMTVYPKYKVAAAHVASVYGDSDKTVDKACACISQAAANGARLVAFPESFIPGFPNWAIALSPLEAAPHFARLAAQAIRIDGPELARIRAAARRHDIFVSMGFTEGTAVSVGCLWNSNILIGPDGAILNHHRKLVPTFFEKLVWAGGDGSGLVVRDTDIGRVGMLICGENTNPLARFSLMAQGEQLHISTYPALSIVAANGAFPAYDLDQAIRIRAAAHSFEAKVFNIVVSAFYDKSAEDYMKSLGPEVARRIDTNTRGISMVVGPAGSIVSETLCESEGFVYAEIDLAEAVEHKRVHDVVGYYNRFDIFKLSVNRSSNRPIYFSAEQQKHDEPSLPASLAADAAAFHETIVND